MRAKLLAALCLPCLLVAGCEDTAPTATDTDDDGTTEEPGTEAAGEGFSISVPSEVHGAWGDEFVVPVTITVDEDNLQYAYYAQAQASSSIFAIDDIQDADVVHGTEVVGLVGLCLAEGSGPLGVVVGGDETPNLTATAATTVVCAAPEDVLDPPACSAHGDFAECSEAGCMPGTSFFGGPPLTCEGREYLDLLQADVYCPDPAMGIVLTVAEDIPTPLAPYDEFGITLVTDSADGDLYNGFVMKYQGDEWVVTLGGLTTAPGDYTVTVAGNELTFEISETALADLGTILRIDASTYSWSPENGQGPSDAIAEFDNEC